MNEKLRIIIEEILAQYPDANLASEQARKQIAQEIVNLYTIERISVELLKKSSEEMV